MRRSRFINPDPGIDEDRRAKRVGAAGTPLGHVNVAIARSMPADHHAEFPWFVTVECASALLIIRRLSIRVSETACSESPAKPGTESHAWNNGKAGFSVWDRRATTSTY